MESPARKHCLVDGTLVFDVCQGALDVPKTAAQLLPFAR